MDGIQWIFERITDFMNLLWTTNMIPGTDVTWGLFFIGMILMHILMDLFLTYIAVSKSESIREFRSKAKGSTMRAWRKLNK